MAMQLEKFRGLTTITFPGQIKDVALVVAGIHASELSGIEIAKWLWVLLEGQAKRPLFTTIMIQEVFPNLAMMARAKLLKEGRNKDADQPLKDVARYYPAMPGAQRI